MTPSDVAGVLARFTPPFLSFIQSCERSGAALSIAARLPDGSTIELGDYVIGDLSQNPYPNAEIAQQKRNLSLRTQMDGTAVPEALKLPSDSPWTGSVFLDSLAVGCAGLSEAQDELLATWCAAALRLKRRELES